MADESKAADDGEWLRDLADYLVARHIKISVPDYGLRRELLAKDDFALWEQSQRRFRCIAVVGAGASAPVLARGDDLASGLIRQFNIEQAAVEAEYERLERITAVDPTEFEAQLSAIGQTLGNSRRVQAAISDLYRVRHPTILGYELLAHLLKHRFVDAIISMNFDELLDQSLDDELGVGEYERIVSDRDCVNVQSSVSAPDYVPLYIKLHGTASEPESLRFTRESYYDSPVQVGTEAARLFQVPECIVLNLGFGMTSFDLHRLLAIPDTLRLYNLSHDPLNPKARKALQRERKRHNRDKPIFIESPENEEKRKTHKVERSREGVGQPTSLRKDERSDASDRAMDSLLTQLNDRVDRLSSSGSFAVALRSVERHRAVVGLLGPASKPGKRLIDLPRSSNPRYSLDPLIRAARPQAVTAGYLLRRTVLELALAMARGRGLVSVASLAVDRCGHYYDAYRRCAGPDPKSWEDLYTLAGFEQNQEVPDVFEATEAIRRSHPGGVSAEQALYEKFLEGTTSEKNEDWHELPELDIGRLVERVLPQIVDSPSEDDFDLLHTELDELYQGTEYEIHSRDDRVCAKTFSTPKTLKTLSAMEAHSFELVKQAATGGAASEVDIISETGDWLLKRKEDFGRRLADARSIRLIVAFLCDVPTLLDAFPGITIRYQQPWHHNRHMVILREKEEPRAALYFARHHRNPYVTPVLVRSPRDIEVLQTTFKNRWHNSRPVNVSGKICV